MADKLIYPSVEYLRECFDLNADTGILRWKSRPIEHFSSASSSVTWHIRFEGKVAGSRDRKGYLSVSIKIGGLKKTFKVHRIVWILCNGKDVAHQIDHINGVKADNRPVNLREATGSENMRNRPAKRDNKAGVKGVFRILLKGGDERFKASIKDRLGTQRHLGTFENIDDAREAYAAAAVREHREFANVG